MKTLKTRVGTYVTGDDVADAVLSYSLALARLQRLDLVDLPFRAENGDLARVQLRVGWMVDMDAVNDGERKPELIEPAVIDDLKAREVALQSHGDTPLVAEELLTMDGLGEY
jgi:hypothetical protein